MAEPVQKTTTLTEEQIHALGNDIFSLSRNSRLILAADVGGLVVARAYQGKFEVFNQRNSSDETIEAISKVVAGLGDTSWDSSTLYRAVRVAEQRKELGGFDRWPRAKYTHFRIVQGLAWDIQRQLLDQVQAQGWNEDALQAEVTRARGKTSEKTEADKSVQEAAVALKRIAKVAEIRDDLAADLGTAGMASEEYSALLSTLSSIAAQVAVIQERLSQLRKRA